VPYRQAIRDKLVGLLVTAGKREAKRYIKEHLEDDAAKIVGLKFPEEWADRILLNDRMIFLVNCGHPKRAERADSSLASEVPEEAERADLNPGHYHTEAVRIRGRATFCRPDCRPRRQRRKSR
jgi:hypothetical protein